MFVVYERRNYLINPIDNTFAEYIMLNQTQFTIHEQHSVSFERDGVYIVIKNHQTKNTIKLRSESDLWGNEIRSLVWAIVKDQLDNTVVLIRLDYFWFNANKLTKDFERQMNKKLKIRRIDKYLDTIFKEEQKRLLV